MAATDPTVEGVLLADKPAGPTSHDMVARTRRALGTRRVGHTGTLDPFASGLLLLLIGRATRIAEYLSGMDKRYSAVVHLGASTDSDDATGAITAEHDATGVTRDAVESALELQRGSILQTPSTISAKKVAGQRAYALARKGHAVELEPVPVTIHSLTITRWALPDVHIDVTCSSGTYIRAIARDLGVELGVGAHLSALRRTGVGPYDVADAVSADTLTDHPDVARAAVIPTLDALGSMPRIELTHDDVAHIRQGQRISRSAEYQGVVALASHGDLIAIAEADAGMIRPRKVFL